MALASNPLDWTTLLRDEWEERAAIREYCGGASRRQAEVYAADEIRNRLARRDKPV